MSEGEAARPALHSLGGAAPDPEVVADLLRIRELPGAARQRLWEVLGPSLPEPIPRDVEALLDRFIAAHGADAVTLARALRAARALVRRASAFDVDPKRFGEDLAALSGGTSELGDVLLPGYERARALVRAEIAERAVAGHGRLLEKVAWRVDILTASDQGLGFKLPVLTLTLHYREGRRREQLSVQVLPHVLGEIRALCDRLLPGRR
jgi:hypothetical protein